MYHRKTETGFKVLCLDGQRSPSRLRASVRAREAATCGPIARSGRCSGPHRRGVFAKTAVQVSGPGRQMLLVQMRSVRGVCESS